MINILAIIVTFSSLVLVTMILHYLQDLGKREKAMKAKERLLLSQAEDIWEDDEQKAAEMVKKTAQRANKLLIEAQYVKEQLQVELTETLGEIIKKNTQVLEMQAEKFQELHRDSLISAKNDFLQQVNRSIEDVRKATEAELEDFMSVLRQETIDAQGIVGKRINESYEKLEKELEKYKKDQMEKIGKETGTLIAKVAQQVLSKTISLHDHEDLVMQALQEAKEKGVFNQ